MQGHLLNHPDHIQAVETENYRRLVKYLKLSDKVDSATREELIAILTFRGLLRRQFKLGWE